MKLLSLTMCSALLLISLLFAPVTGDPIIITDDLGREITLENPVQTIAFQHYATAEALKIAGVWDRVVARDGYITDEQFFPGLSEIPAVNPPSGNLDLNYETIFETSPDIFIIQKQDWSLEQINTAIQKLEPEIPVVVLDFIDPLNAESSFDKLGKITENQAETDKFARFVKDTISQIQDKTSTLSDEDKPSVFFKAPSYKPDQIFTYGNGMEYWADMLDIAGGKNAVTNQTAAWFEVDNEWLLKTDMDVIISHCRESLYPEIFGYQVIDPSATMEKADGIISGITATDVLSGSDAIKNQDIYLIADPLAGTPRSIIGIAYLAKWLHPDLFTDLNPEEIHQEYLTEYIGADYDLKDTGLFGFPA